MTDTEERSEHSSRSEGRRWRKSLWICCALALVVFVVTTARLFVWPDVPSPPPHADAIIELAGPGDRDQVTIELAEQGRAPLVSQSTLPQDVAGHACLDPIPGVVIRCFSPSPPTTRGEARYIGRLAAKLNLHSVILVTTTDHAWRARLRVVRCFPGKVYVATSPLPHWYDWFRQIPYQWAATLKAELFQRGC
jgi:hypothetical protein